MWGKAIKIFSDNFEDSIGIPRKPYYDIQAMISTRDCPQTNSTEQLTESTPTHLNSFDVIDLGFLPLDSIQTLVDHARYLDQEEVEED